MIGESLDVLPDVLYYHRPAVKDLRDFANVIFFSATNKILVDQASSGRLTISQLLGGSPSILSMCYSNY